MNVDRADHCAWAGARRRTTQASAASSAALKSAAGLADAWRRRDRVRRSVRALQLHLAGAHERSRSGDIVHSDRAGRVRLGNGRGQLFWGKLDRSRRSIGSMIDPARSDGDLSDDVRDRRRAIATSRSRALFLVGSATALASATQTRLMDVAGKAQTMAAALNHSSFNTGNALGALLGGLVIAAGWGWTRAELGRRRACARRTRDSSGVVRRAPPRHRRRARGLERFALADAELLGRGEAASGRPCRSPRSAQSPSNSNSASAAVGNFAATRTRSSLSRAISTERSWIAGLCPTSSTDSRFFGTPRSTSSRSFVDAW